MSYEKDFPPGPLNSNTMKKSHQIQSMKNISEESDWIEKTGQEFWISVSNDSREMYKDTAFVKKQKEKRYRYYKCGWYIRKKNKAQ